ncbi:ankyrin [Thozetella sp. PMI_491]|nr:ankyrin [Thozetella sp. PMI_491]
MDPISVIGLLSSVSELVGASKTILDCIRTFKNCEIELAALSYDISAFTEALAGFKRVLRAPSTLHRVSRPALEDALERSRLLVGELRARLLQLSGSSLSVASRAKWVQHKASIIKLHAQVKEQNAILRTFLEIITAETFIDIANQYPRFMISKPSDESTPPSATSEERSAGSVHLMVPWTRERPRRTSIASESTSSVESDSNSYMERASIFSSVTSVESSTPWGSSVSLNDSALDITDPDKKARTSTDIVHQRARQRFSEDMFVVRTACRYNCHCECHNAPQERQYRIYIGSKRQRTHCTDTKCTARGSLEAVTEEHSRSFRRALFQVMSAKSIQICDLATFRIVPEGSNALRYVKHGNLEKLKECIESKEATIWDTAPDGWSLLHTAAYSRQVDIVKYLLACGASTSAGDVGARTPVDFAVLNSIGGNATETEKRLVQAFGDKDDVLSGFDFTPIHIAALGLYSDGHSERPRLQEHLVDDANDAPAATNWTKWKSQFNGRSPLFAAVLEYFRASAFEKPKGTKITHNLIDQKDKKYHWTPLHWAAASGRVEEMRILVERGADPLLVSNLGANIIHAAAESKLDSGLAAVLKIWSRCPDKLDINQTNIWGETAVHITSRLSASCVKLLLDAGADPTIQDENGQTALHFAGLSAQSTERLKIVSVLCDKHDARCINIQDFDGRPPLFDFLDDPECVEVLVRHGAKVYLADNYGKSAFHHACIQGESATLETLLRLANCPDAAVAKDNSGNAPLIEALANAHVDCAMKLLKLDSVGLEMGKEGWAPIHYASKIGDSELLEAVCQHPGFQMLAKTLDGKRARVVAMESGNWHGRVKDLILQYDCIEWDD